MKKFILILMTVLFCFTLTGCDYEEEYRAAMKQLGVTETNLEDWKAKYNHIKSNVAYLAYGEQYTLSQDHTNSPVTETLVKLNSRIQKMTGIPNKDDINEITNTVDLLLSQLVEKQKKGDDELAKKDAKIQSEDDEIARMVDEYNKQKKQFDDYTLKLAKQVDDNNKFKDQMNHLFGIGAIEYGFKRLITSTIWMMVGGTVIFFAIRVLSGLNVAPIFNIILNGFETVGASILSVIKWIIPGAFKAAGYIESKIFNNINVTHQAVIDEIATLKTIQNESPNTVYTLDDLITRLQLNLNEKQKNKLETALTELRWDNKLITSSGSYSVNVNQTYTPSGSVTGSL